MTSMGYEQNSRSDLEREHEGTILSRVYFLLDRDACEIKIGYTTNMDRRQAQLERQRGRKLDLLGAIPAGRHVETMFHRRWDRYRNSGDWFSSEIIGEIAPILEDAA